MDSIKPSELHQHSKTQPNHRRHCAINCQNLRNIHSSRHNFDVESGAIAGCLKTFRSHAPATSILQGSSHSEKGFLENSKGVGEEDSCCKIASNIEYKIPLARPSCTTSTHGGVLGSVHNEFCRKSIISRNRPELSAHFCRNLIVITDKALNFISESTNTAAAAAAALNSPTQKHFQRYDEEKDGVLLEGKNSLNDDGEEETAPDSPNCRSSSAASNNISRTVSQLNSLGPERQFDGCRGPDRSPPRSSSPPGHSDPPLSCLPSLPSSPVSLLLKMIRINSFSVSPLTALILLTCALVTGESH